MLNGGGSMKPELVVIFGNWCAKCNMMMPIVEEIALEYRDVLQVTKVEVKDENEDLQENYGIEIPAVNVKWRWEHETGTGCDFW